MVLKEFISIVNALFSGFDITYEKVQEYRDGQQMPNITNHQGNTNRNHREIAPHFDNGCIKKTTNSKCWQGHEEKGTLVHYW